MNWVFKFNHIHAWLAVLAVYQSSHRDIGMLELPTWGTIFPTI